MEIKITEFVESAKDAEGIVVIIDVFRAFSTAYFLFANGAKAIIPVSDKSEAFKLKEENPDYILMGEEMGTMVKRFDYGNSPSEIKSVDFTGKTVVIRSTSGTQGLVNVDKNKAKEVIAGSFMGVKAIVDYIKTKNPEQVTLVSLDNVGQGRAVEDYVCAECIRDLLEGKDIDYNIIFQKIRDSPAASDRFFDETKTHSPVEDFHLCLKFNMFDFAILYDPEKNVLTQQKS